MRIVLYHAGHEWSGRARVFASAAAALRARGHEAVVVCGEQTDVERHVIELGERPEAIPLEGMWHTQARALREIVDRVSADVIFVHDEAEHLVAAWAGRSRRAAVVRRVPPDARPIIGASTRLALASAPTSLLYTSTGETLSAQTLRGAYAPGVADVGVDVASYGPRDESSGERTTLMVAVCGPGGRARSATVLRTVALLLPRHSGLRLAFVGPGSDDEDLRMHAIALGLGGLVHHLGERDDHLAVVAAADLCWVAAEGDDAAYGALDAMAMRLPVVVERGTIGQRYVADSITGIVLGADATGAAALVAGLLADRDRRRAMGSAGRTRAAREFSLAAMAAGFERAAQNAIERKPWTR